MKKCFASDNTAPVHDKIMQALVKANEGPSFAYGEDSYTASTTEKMKAEFGEESSVNFVWNGTAANVLALKTLSRSINSIVASDCSHLNNDECSAPEASLGTKIVTLANIDGKISSSSFKDLLSRPKTVHRAKPAVLSLTQATEHGTLYKPGEIKELADLAHENGLMVHMDGARISNAAAALNLSLREATFDLGVDALSFGGTKNGLLGAEAVVFKDRAYEESCSYFCKQGLHLASKMRFLAVQFEALLAEDLWRDLASHANEMASYLGQNLEELGIKLSSPVQINAVFPNLGSELCTKLRAKGFVFYDWDLSLGTRRLMCSFATQKEDIDFFTEQLGFLLKQG